MKIRITFKDPDGVNDCLQDAARESLKPISSGLTSEELSDLVESRMNRLIDDLKPWVEYSEYICVEFDLDNGTAVVVPLSEW